MILCFSFVFFQILFTAADYWLNIWTNAEEARTDSLIDNGTIIYEPTSWNSWYKQVDTQTGIYVYSILVASCTVFAITRAIHFFVYCTNSSIKLHDKMFMGVIQSPLLFFDSNPIGNDILSYF